MGQNINKVIWNKEHQSEDCANKKDTIVSSSETDNVQSGGNAQQQSVKENAESTDDYADVQNPANMTEQSKFLVKLFSL